MTDKADIYKPQKERLEIDRSETDRPKKNDTPLEFKQIDIDRLA